ncbi:hypothetical protein [Thalassobacillus hwangdonensis]|uniref:Uncharacterized protein n=1 Tax=Thalassobacillus hwangdonensis TaxID=546108 RepID=A0ABW3L035_9BACI
MGTLVDFGQYKQKRRRREGLSEKRVVYEVYLTTVKYVYKHIEQEFDNPVEHLTTAVNLSVLYKQDRNRFAATFADLISYWNLSPLTVNAIPVHRAFDEFETLGDLCAYIERRVREEK